MSTQLFSAHLSLSLICFTHTHKHTLSHTEKYKYVYTHTHTHRPLPSNLSLSVFNLSLGSLPVTGSDLNVIRLLSTNWQILKQLEIPPHQVDAQTLWADVWLSLNATAVTSTPIFLQIFLTHFYLLIVWWKCSPSVSSWLKFSVSLYWCWGYLSDAAQHYLWVSTPIYWSF